MVVTFRCLQLNSTYHLLACGILYWLQSSMIRSNLMDDHGYQNPFNWMNHFYTHECRAYQMLKNSRQDAPTVSLFLFLEGSTLETYRPSRH